MLSKASNAVLAKARAMYSGRLTKQNYAELMNCRDVPDVANYLRSSTAYANVLDKSTTTAYHRRQLESAVYSELYLRMAGLCRYLAAAGDGFYEYLVLRTDMEQLVHCVRNLNSSHPGDFIIRIPDYFSKYSELKQPLYSVTDFKGLTQALEGTPYASWFEPFSRRNVPDFFDMETMLNRKYHELCQRMVAKSCHGEEKKSLEKLFGFETDIENIISVYRLKKMGQNDAASIKDVVLENPASRFTPAQWMSVEQADSAEAVLEELRNTEYASMCGDGYIERAGERLIYDKAKKQLRFSADPCVVMLCYINLLENEVRNLIHIIEGIRYKLPVSEIGELLIGAGD